LPIDLVLKVDAFITKMVAFDAEASVFNINTQYQLPLGGILLPQR
jgi:hypothetical protein